MTWLSDARSLWRVKRKLKDPRPDVRVAALKELAEVARPAAVKTLLRALDDPASGVVEASVFAMSASRCPGAFELIAQGLRATSPKVRLGAANALGVRAGAIEEERDRAFDALFAAARTEPNESAVMAMALSLYNTKDARTVDALLALLASRDRHRVRAAASVLGFTGDRRIFGPLAAALEKADEADVMYAIAMALASLDDTRAVDVILARWAKPDAVVAGTQDLPRFLDALFAIKHPVKVSRLIRALTHEVQRVRVVAALALGETRDPRAVVPLRRLLSGDDPALRAAAVQALETLGEAAASVASESDHQGREAPDTTD